MTVDVTGTWRTTEGDLVEFALDQQGAKVRGSMRAVGVVFAWPWTNISGPIDGTVAGDVFRFKQTGGVELAVNGEMTVSGDEMKGYVNAGNRVAMSLRRIDSSAPPSPQQR